MHTFCCCCWQVSEGIDFSDRAGRGVVITGLPFPAAHDPHVKLQKQLLDEEAHAGHGGIMGGRGMTGDQWWVRSYTFHRYYRKSQSKWCRGPCAVYQATGCVLLLLGMELYYYLCCCCCCCCRYVQQCLRAVTPAVGGVFCECWEYGAACNECFRITPVCCC